MKAAALIVLLPVMALAGSTGVVWRASNGLTDFRESMPYPAFGTCVAWHTHNKDGAITATSGILDGSLDKCVGTQSSAGNQPVAVSGETNGVRCYLFDGVNDYYTNSSTYSIGTGDVSMSAWVKTTNASLLTIVSRRSASGNEFYGVTLETTTSGRAEVYFHAVGAANIATNGGTVITDGKWHHLCGVWARNGSETIYVDGVAEASRSISGGASYNYVPDKPWSVGAVVTRATYPNGGGFWRGYIDDACVWSSALASNVVYSIYIQGSRTHPK